MLYYLVYIRPISFEEWLYGIILYSQSHGNSLYIQLLNFAVFPDFVNHKNYSLFLKSDVNCVLSSPVRSEIDTSFDFVVSIGRSFIWSGP